VLDTYVDLLDSWRADERIGNSLVTRKAAGVVAAISPWNYPLHRAMTKIAAALAAGCTAVTNDPGHTSREVRLGGRLQPVRGLSSPCRYCHGCSRWWRVTAQRRVAQQPIPSRILTANSGLSFTVKRYIPLSSTRGST
jgi:hypothetical protein